MPMSRQITFCKYILAQVWDMTEVPDDDSVVRTSISGMYNKLFHDPEVMGSNPGQVELGAHSPFCLSLA